MRALIPRTILSVLLVGACLADTSVVTTRDGKHYKEVSSVVIEGDGRIKIVHAGGIVRTAPGNLMPESQKAHGLEVTDPEEAEIINLGEIKTNDGKHYSKVARVKITPSFISFIHSEGATSVRFENLSEEIRTKCKYDPELAKEFDEQREANYRAMLEAEHRIEIARQKAERNAALRKSREEALGLLYYTTIGSTRYWTQDPRLRQLTDSTAYTLLTNGGFSPEEANYHLNRLKFR